MLEEIIKLIPDLNRYVRFRLNDKMWVEDVVQETLLYLLLKIDDIEVTNIKGLVLNTANFFISKYRDKKIYNNDIPESPIKFNGNVIINKINTYNIEDKLFNNLLSVNATHLEKLLLQIHGYSIKEISEIYNTNNNTTKTHIKRCKDYLRK